MPPKQNGTQGMSDDAAGDSELPFPPITVQCLEAGDAVDVFHRYAQDPNGYFMVDQVTSGILHPSIGKTDGWTKAVVTERWEVSSFNRDSYETWPSIQWTHPTWFNRRGWRLDNSQPSMVTQRVLPEQIRQKSAASEVHQQPVLSLFHVRWGGNQPVNPVTKGAGGWGAIGSTPSDNYINGLEDFIFRSLGPTYEIYSAFFQNSEELLKISAPFARSLLRGKHVGALYFCWPIIFQDGHEVPAYVDAPKLLELMVTMEASGICTRFPHQSNLYKVFASKEWTSQMCLHPLLKTPLTTRVARQAIATDPCKAADMALQALARLSEVRSAWAEPLGHPPREAVPIDHGVAKLGWSWEAMDVQAWTNKQELSVALTSLAEQPGSLMEFVFVQEHVDFEVEMRHFVVEPDLTKPQTLKPKKIIYTVFKCKEGGSFRDFDRYDRRGCLKACFLNDDAALADAERQAEELITRWLQWLQAQTHDMPTVVRFDIFAKRLGPGKATVMTGELTELGGCFLGWLKGPQVVFGALLRSCFKDPVAIA